MDVGNSRGGKLFFPVSALNVSSSIHIPRQWTREKSQQRHCDMRRHLDLCSTLDSRVFYGMQMLNTNPSTLWQMRFNWWAIWMREWYPYYLWLQNMLDNDFHSSHLQLLVFSLYLRLWVHKVLPSFAFQLHKATLLKIPEIWLLYSMSPWEVNKCQRNVGLFMYLLGLCYISETALWHLVITSLEDITQSNRAVNVSKESQCFPQ